MAGSKGMLAARQPLVVPMLLRLSQFKLRSIVVLVVSKQKGITLVFKTDPLQNVDISSTFDSIAVIQNFIQREIEGQLRQMFREDLPGIIHRLSQQWIKAKVEAPYLNKRPTPHSYSSAPNLSIQNVARLPTIDLIPRLQRQHLHPPSAPSLRRPPLSASIASSSRRQPVSEIGLRSAPVVEPSSDSESFDPTYGLRPDDLPTKSMFKGFSSLFTPTKGLAELAEEEEYNETVDYDDNSTSFDMVEWENGLPVYTPPPTEIHVPTTEYESIPAVGGGVITRPRILHSQSMAQPPGDHRPRPFSRNPSFDGISLLSGLVTPGLSRHPQTAYTSYFPDVSPDPAAPPLRTAPPYFKTHARPITPDSLETSYSHDQTPPEPSPPPDSEELLAPPANSERERRYSISSSLSNIDPLDPDPKIILRPSSINTTLQHLTTLSHNNHTLSPYTRSVEHYTVRSVPPRPVGFHPQSTDRPPVKAKRKRTYHLGGQPQKVMASPNSLLDHRLPSPVNSPISDADFDASDMDRYFRAYDDHSKPPSDPSQPVRLRKSYVHPDRI